jgi:hypothetical protein
MIFILLGYLIRGILFFTLIYFGKSILIAYNIIDLVPHGSIEIEVEPYLETFETYCIKYNKDCSKLNTLSIKLGEIPPLFTLTSNVVGLCDQNNTQILLSREYWSNAIYLERELLVFHELGHCILMKEHTDPRIDDHIMNPTMMDSNGYQLMYQKLMNELFDCSKNCPEVYFKRERYL